MNSQKYWVRLAKKAPPSVRRFVFMSRPLLKLLNHEFFGHDQLDRKLLDYLDLSRPGFFVELGANNGVAQSNTKHLELYHSWQGVLVEPYPANFEQLKMTRSRKTRFFWAACVSFQFKEPSVKLIYSNLMTIAKGLENDKKNVDEWAKSGAKFLDENSSPHEFTAPARTLQSILEEAIAPRKIDLLSLDVEGAEMEVLKGIDWKYFSFDFICIETDSFEAIKEFLLPFGYSFRLKLSDHDYLFESGK